MKKAVFLDKDGTIIPNIPYNIDVSKTILQPQTVNGLRALQDKGYLLIIVTNQSGIGKNLFSEQDFVVYLHKLLDLFLDNGVFITSYYYCPHQEGLFFRTCWCRKPSPELILQAAKDFSIDLSESWTVGDILNDIEAGKRAKTQTILVDGGNEKEWIDGMFRQPDFIVENFLDAAKIITLKNTRKEQYIRSVF